MKLSSIRYTVLQFLCLYAIFIVTACNSNSQQSMTTQEEHTEFLESITYEEALNDTDNTKTVEHTQEEWKNMLSSAEYRILRNKGTEIPYINEYDGFYEEGVYLCRACGNPLFHSDAKYNSRTGWPSFWEPIREGAVGEEVDKSLFMTRTETVCARCGSHIGHVFDDGPDPTGLRYCMNSQAMYFVPKPESES